MIDFNFDLADEFHVDTSGDGVVKLRFGERTLGVDSLSESPGYVITNDWNTRHFTLAFGEDSVLYHLTREGDNPDREAGKRAMPREEYIAEIYGYVRALAPPVHESEVDIELVGKLDIVAAKEYLTEEGVVDETSHGIRVDNEREEGLVDELYEDPGKLGNMFSQVLDPVSFDAMRESGEIIFVRPTPHGVILIFLYPDDYIGIVEATTFFEGLMEGGGSQLMDHAVRSITTD